MVRISFLALVIALGGVSTPLGGSAFADEFVKGYASATVTRFNERGDVVARIPADNLPAIPPEGVKAERAKMGLVRVQFGNETYFFNHSQLEMTGTIPAALKGACNKVRSAPGDKRNTNIGMGLGGCN